MHRYLGVVDKRGQKPKTKNVYLLYSHIRLSDDVSYINFIQSVIYAKKNKTRQVYINKTF